MTADFYDRLKESIAPTHPPIIDLGDDSDFIASYMANQESFYQCRSTPASPVARASDDANDTMNVNIGTSMPLSEHVIGESSHVAESRVDTSNTMEEEYDPDSPVAYALWLPENDCVGPLSMRLINLVRQDALNLNYPKVADTLNQFYDGYRLVIGQDALL